MSVKKKLLIVDDHVIMREGLVSLFKNQPDFEVVGEVGTAEEAIEKAAEHRPDFILMDIGLPEISGVEATRVILSRFPEIKIVMLTVHGSDEHLFEAIKSGAKGYLLKNSSVSHIITSLRALDRGEAALSRKMTVRIIDEISRIEKIPGKGHETLENLTPREMDVFRLLADNSTNKQIARQLVISTNTVKNHVHNILLKLNFNNRYEASKFARRVLKSNNHDSD